MADTKLSNLSALATEPADTDEFYINDGGVSKKIAWSTIKAVFATAAAFDANTILAADSDDTPAALTVAEQTLVGRITAGNIDALTATEVRTLLNVDDGATDKPVEAISIAVSDETTDLTTGTGKVTFRMPYAFTLTEVRASVNTAPTGSTIIVDINDSGSTIMTTNKISIDASEKTSETAATAPTLTDTALADDAEITIDIDQIGSSTAGTGLKVTLIGTRT